jgi:DinB superfamily
MKNSDEIFYQFLSEALNLIDSCIKLFGELTETQINWKPSENKWSVGECLTHLVITHKLYNSKIDKIQAKPELYGEGSSAFKHTFFGKTLLKYVDPDSTKKLKTFNIFKPKAEKVDTSIINSFCSEVEAMISFAEKFNGADLTKIKFSSPATKLFKMNLGDALLINLYHDERHLNQAKSILNKPNFSK